jgi:hypothetical protein
MKRSLVGMMAVVMVLGVCAVSAWSTQIILQTPQELAQESSLIVDGKVSGVRSYWNADHSKILTEATVVVGETHKGSGVASVRVVQLGGVVGNVRMTAHGALGWKRGEEVLLFLEPSLGDAYQVTGFSQGKYAIERDARTGKAFVRQAMPADTEGAQAPATGAAQPAGAGRVTLEQFLNQVLPQR